MTADPTGWPDASKPGVPLNPEQDGAHRIAFPKGEHDWIWRAGPRPFWVTQTRTLVAPHEMPSYRARYIGPCLTPEMVAAAQAQARREGMEEAARIAHEAWQDGVPPAEIADAIRAKAQEPTP
jgi:hypothetical protein